MLRITPQATSDGSPGFRLDGSLTGDTRDLLEQALELPAEGALSLQLDLSGLTYADAEGARFLRGLLSRGSTLLGCSSFVAKLLGSA